MTLTCRQAYNEAATIYCAAYCRFWQTNRFEVKVNYNTRLGETQAACWSKPPPPQLPSGGLALDWVITRLEEVSPDVCSNWDRVHNLRISDCPGMSDSINWDLLPSSGGWRTSSDDRSQWCIPLNAHVYRSGQTVVVLGKGSRGTSPQHQGTDTWHCLEVVLTLSSLRCLPDRVPSVADGKGYGERLRRIEECDGTPSSWHRCGLGAEGSIATVVLVPGAVDCVPGMADSTRLYFRFLSWENKIMASL